MRFDDNDRMESKESMDSAPVYPPTSRGASESPATRKETSNRIEPSTQVTDREIPIRQGVDVPADAARGAETALFEGRELEQFNSRWSEIQTSFVDEPRRAVQQADALVSDVITEIGQSFGKQRAHLEAQWDRGGDVSTEDLRQVFQRYRSFFSRLLDL